MIAEILSMMETKEEAALEEDSEEEILDPMWSLASMDKIWKGWALTQAKSSKCSLVVQAMKVFKALRVSKALEVEKSEVPQRVRDSLDSEELEDSKTLAFLDFFN